MSDVINENLDLWSSALLTKSTAGRGSNGKLEAYGIKKLRELILELAVRGKLVPQDPNDEPASLLLERARAEQEKLIAVGKAKREKSFLAIADADKQSKLPKGWILVRLGALLLSIKSGGTPSKHNPAFWNGEIPWASVKDLGFGEPITSTQDYITLSGLEAGSCLAEAGSMLICTRMGLGKIGEALIDVAINQDLKAVMLTTALVKQYFINYYKTILITGTGMTVAGIKQDELLNFIVPLPPLAEQHRIVAKVDELMALCDQLEQQQTDSIEAHQTLVETLLGTLTSAASPEEFAEAWTRIADHFDTLFTTEQSIDQLKQTILQLAVMGKLVPQDPDDEPASVLLEKIAKEKEQLKIRKQKIEPEISEEGKPHLLPISWEWVRFGDIAFQITDGAHHTPEYVSEGIPFLSVKDMSSGKLDFSDTRFITRNQHEELIKRCYPQMGDLLLTKVGTTGIPVLVDTDEEFSIFVSVALIKFPQDKIQGRYLSLLVESPLVKRQSEEGTEGIGNKNLVLRKIAAFVLAVPPLNEQHRIVAKVDELMALCDALKARLSEAQTTQIHLADAIVEQAVA